MKMRFSKVAKPNGFIQQLPLAARLMGLAGLLVALSLPSAAIAEGVVTLSGMEIKGRIVSEDDEQIILENEYGQLRFLKVRLKSVMRGGSGGGFGSSPAAPPPAASNGGFGAGFFDPFSGGAPPAPAPAPGGFGGFGQAVDQSGHGANNPFGGPMGGTDPFGGWFSSPSPPATRATPAPPPTPSPVPVRPRFITPQRDADPLIPPRAAGIMYGLGAEGPAFWRESVTANWTPASTDTPVRPGMEIQSRETPTTRILFSGSGDQVRLPQESQIQLVPGPMPQSVQGIVLSRGAVWIQLANEADREPFRVTTTEMVVTSRGGLLMVDRGVSASRVSVENGEAFLRAQATGVYVTLRSGQSAVVNVNGQILDVTAPPTPLTQAWEAWDETPLPSLLPTTSLLMAVHDANAAWEAEMRSYAPQGATAADGFEIRSAVGELKYQERLNQYADAFMRLAADTGVIPNTPDGWSMLRFDTGLPGWNGPYVEGPVPPLDPWRQPLVYRSLVSSVGNPFGRVYSIWQDGRDQGGENASVDKVALIMYFNLEAFRNHRNASGN